MANNIPAWQKSAVKKAAKLSRGAGGKFAGKAAAAAATKTAAKTVAGGATTAATKEGFMKLLSSKGLGTAMKAHPFQSAIGIFFLVQMIMNQLKKHGGTFLGQSLQRQQIEAQTSASPEDVYYQAMLPQLSQERQGAQNALLQAIVSGGGEMPSVPGERMIGG